jgi:uncharacterized protein (DUF849 family)
MKNKRIITCAVTGSVNFPTMTEYLPITPQEIAQNALDAASAGAAAVHLHARDPQTGQPSPRHDLFEEIINRIRDKNQDVLICLTTGGGAMDTVEQRVAVVPKFKPDLASCNSGSINWGIFAIMDKYSNFKHQWEYDYLEMFQKGFVFQNTFADIMGFVKIMYDNGTKPEFEVYDVGHLYNLKFLVDKGYIKTPIYLQFCTGILGGIGSTPYDIMNLHQTADRLFGKENYVWSVFGGGRKEFPACTQGLLLGGNVRVGLEDNIMLRRGVLAKNNAELVEKMVRIMRELEFEPATSGEARQILGLK